MDNNSCCQSIALNNAAWAVGGTNVYKHSECRNLNSVSVEMCCCGNYAVSEQTENNAVQLCAELCRYLGIKSNEVDTYVLRHWDVWAKECPKGFTGNNNARWNGFREKVKAALNGETEELTMTQYEELQKQIEALSKADREKDGIIKSLEDRVHTLENPMIYNYIDRNMPEWAREDAQWYTDRGIVEGTGEGLNLDDTKLWMLVVIRRVIKKIENVLKIKL